MAQRGELICPIALCPPWSSAPSRQAFKDAISTILFDGLVPAFNNLKKIRASVTQEMPLVDRWLLFEEFFGKLWFAYKELMPKAALVLGFNIGFLFQKETKFEADSWSSGKLIQT